MRKHARISFDLTVGDDAPLEMLYMVMYNMAAQANAAGILIEDSQVTDGDGCEVSYPPEHLVPLFEEWATEGAPPRDYEYIAAGLPDVKAWPSHARISDLRAKDQAHVWKFLLNLYTSEGLTPAEIDDALERANDERLINLPIHAGYGF